MIQTAPTYKLVLVTLNASRRHMKNRSADRASLQQRAGYLHLIVPFHLRLNPRLTSAARRTKYIPGFSICY